MHLYPYSENYELFERIIINDIDDFIYGNYTSNFLIFNDIKVIPWNCISLFDKRGETIDLIFQNEEETFIFWCLLSYLIQKLNNPESGIKVCLKKFVYKFLWQKVYLMLRYRLYSNII